MTFLPPQTQLRARGWTLGKCRSRTRVDQGSDCHVGDKGDWTPEKALDAPCPRPRSVLAEPCLPF